MGGELVMCIVLVLWLGDVTGTVFFLLLQHCYVILNLLLHRCDPTFVRYQFHTQFPHCTGGVPQAGEAGWNDSHILLLGTIDRQLLVEYLRGPPLVLELHDRSRRAEDRTLPALFGEEVRDDVLGTHAFTAGKLQFSRGDKK